MRRSAPIGFYARHGFQPVRRALHGSRHRAPGDAPALEPMSSEGRSPPDRAAVPAAAGLQQPARGHAAIIAWCRARGATCASTAATSSRLLYDAARACWRPSRQFATAGRGGDRAGAPAGAAAPQRRHAALADPGPAPAQRVPFRDARGPGGPQYASAFLVNDRRGYYFRGTRQPFRRREPGPCRPAHASCPITSAASGSARAPAPSSARSASEPAAAVPGTSSPAARVRLHLDQSLSAMPTCRHNVGF